MFRSPSARPLGWMVSMLGVLGSVMATAAPAWADPPTWAYEVHEDRLSLRLGATTVAEYVYIDPKILRPYFTRLRTPAGLLVTRQHPPVKDVDATDHDTMHPGLWLAFGDINGHDFWRNVARIKHVGLTTPEVEADRLRFAACSRLVTPQGAVIGRVESEFTFAPSPPVGPWSGGRRFMRSMNRCGSAIRRRWASACGSPPP